MGGEVLMNQSFIIKILPVNIFAIKQKNLSDLIYTCNKLLINFMAHARMRIQ